MHLHMNNGDSIGETDVKNDNLNEFNFKLKSISQQWVD